MLPHEDDPSPHAVELPIRVVNAVSEAFEVRTVCISIDERRAMTGEVNVPGLALQRRETLQLSVKLRPGVMHTVRFRVLAFGTGAADGYTFVVTSEHVIDAEELRPEPLTVTFVEGADRAGPIERRPQVRWSGPGRASK